MSDVELPPNWEAVVGEDGRTYYWNVDTDETSWTVPEVVKAKSAVAADYAARVAASSSGSGSSSARELAELRESGSMVQQLSQRFGAQEIIGDGEGSSDWPRQHERSSGIGRESEIFCFSYTTMDELVVLRIACSTLPVWQSLPSKANPRRNQSQRWQNTRRPRQPWPTAEQRRPPCTAARMRHIRLASR